jgi:NAD(P)-dependent dehydrogenase (short-subunit alcohol dehydrogenase family)
VLLRRLRPGHAIVTGAASGLGRAIAAGLVAEGWTVARVDLAGAAWPPPDEPGGLCIALDVRDAAGWRDLHDRLRSEWPALDLLVNAAGVGAAGEVGTLPAEQWRRVVETNLLGTAYGCETFVSWLRSGRARGHLVNVASIAGLVALPAMAAYSASKAGVVALSNAIAAECPRRELCVTVVCPGFFRSGLLETWHFASPTAEREARRRMAATRWTSDRLARRVLRGVARHRRYVVVGMRARCLWRLARLAPRITPGLIRLVYRRLRG